MSHRPRNALTQSSRLVADLTEDAAQHALLEVVVHGFKLVPDDTIDPAAHLIMERLPQFVDRREGVVEDQQGVEPSAVKGSD